MQLLKKSESLVKTKQEEKPKRKQRISHASAKARARNLQKWVCKVISKILRIPWGKDELIRSREMGQPGVDVPLLGRAFKLCPFTNSITIKGLAVVSFISWIVQIFG